MQLETPVRHLLVDLDGTLLGNRNFPLSIDFVRQVMQFIKKNYGSWRKGVRTLLAIRNEFERPSKEQTNDVRIVALFARRMNLTIEEARRVLRETSLTIFPSLEKYFYPMPGAASFLDWAKDRYTLTLATNPVWPREVIEMRLKWAGIDPSLFQKITDVRSMHACKPAPEYYTEILEDQKLRAEECLLIGNELKMDVPATLVGVRVFVVGNFKTVSAIKFTGAKAPAWRGSFRHLREALEKAPT